MFAAALIYSAKGVELSIYSTCKRISQKLLRNVLKFLGLIYEGLKVPPFKEIRCNMEELVLQGPDGPTDVRIVNSYPSKVFSFTHARSIAVPQPASDAIALPQPASDAIALPSLKCLTPTVRCLNRSESFRAALKCSPMYCSASSCSPRSAAALHLMSDL